MASFLGGLFDKKVGGTVAGNLLRSVESVTGILKPTPVPTQADFDAVGGAGFKKADNSAPSPANAFIKQVASNDTDVQNAVKAGVMDKLKEYATKYWYAVVVVVGGFFYVIYRAFFSHGGKTPYKPSKRY